MLASLGALYTRGQSVAWEQLHPGGGRCVSAPTYPWQRERFWLDTAPPTTSARPARSDQSPWRGPIRSSAQPNTVFCEIDVGIDLMPMLIDHRVHGSVVVPAATLLKLVSQATVRAFGAPRPLRDVVFHRSLVLDGAQRRTVQLVLQGDPSGPGSVRVHGMDSAARRDRRRGRCWRAASSIRVSRTPATTNRTSPRHPKSLRRNDFRDVVLQSTRASTVCSTGRASRR